MIVANPAARGNIDQGQTAFRRGLRDRESVFRFHLRWNRGAAADHHFANGYREAAETAGVPYEETREALRFIDWLLADLTPEEKTRKREIWEEERRKQYGTAA